MRFEFGSSINEISKHSKVAIALTNNDNRHYYLYFFDLILKLKDKGVQITILNLEYPNLVTSDVVPLLRNQRNRDKQIQRASHNRNVFLGHVESFCEIRDFDLGASTPRLYSLIAKRSLTEILDANQVIETARNSIESICAVNILKTASQDKSLSRFQINSILKLIDSYKATYQLFVEDSSKNSYDAVVVLNGRVPNQAAIVDAAKFLGLERFYLEHGAMPGQSYHLQNFQTQDNFSFQDFFWQCIPQIEESQRKVMIQAAQKWLCDRRMSPPTFGNPITSSEIEYFRKSRRKIAFFTSSLSEFDLYNNSPNNLNQVDSFRHLLNLLALDSNDELVVRIHPNQVNYSIRDLIKILTVFKNYATTIIFPWDSDSSYEIASQADLCFFWDSTLGLETMINSKREIYILTSSSYNSLSGVSIVNFDNPSIKTNSTPLTRDQIEIAMLYTYYRFIGHGEPVTINSASLKIDLGLIDNRNRMLDQADKGSLQYFWYLINLLLRICYGHATLLNYLQLIRRVVGIDRAQSLLSASLMRFIK